MVNKTQPITDEEFLRIVQNPEYVYFLGMVQPRRPGILLFTVKLEYLHFPPDTERNQLFQLIMVDWEEMKWAAIGIPRREKAIAEKVAKSAGVRIANGVPVLINRQLLVTSRTRIDGVEAEYLAPPETPNLFALENVKSHPIYAGSHEVMIAAEDEEIQRIISSGKGTSN